MVKVAGEHGLDQTGAYCGHSELQLERAEVPRLLHFKMFKHFYNLRFETLTFIPLDFEPLRLRLGDFHTSTPLYLLL